MRCPSALAEWGSRAPRRRLVGAAQRRAAARVAPLLRARWYCHEWERCSRPSCSSAPRRTRAASTARSSPFTTGATWTRRPKSPPRLPRSRRSSPPPTTCIPARTRRSSARSSSPNWRKSSCAISACGGSPAASALAAPGGGGAAARACGAVAGDGAAVARARCDAIRTRWRQRLRTCSRELREWMLMVEVRAMAPRCRSRRRPG